MAPAAVVRLNTGNQHWKPTLATRVWSSGRVWVEGRDGNVAGVQLSSDRVWTEKSQRDNFNVTASERAEPRPVGLTGARGDTCRSRPLGQMPGSLSSMWAVSWVRKEGKAKPLSSCRLPTCSKLRTAEARSLHFNSNSGRDISPSCSETVFIN